MEIAFFLVLLAIAVLAVTAIAGRLGWSAPLLLVAAGVLGSYLPGVPEVHLPHDVVLLGLLPPLLYAAALQTSLVDFNANRRSILLLSVGLVVFTTVGVAAVVHALLDVEWAVALAIGAVVAPPDAVAATAIARRIGLPRRVVTILEGESLLNDATALVALRMAIAATAGTVSLVDVGLDFARAAGGGVLIGLICVTVVAWVRRHVTDALLDTAISLVTPFAAYLVAEKLHASGVLAVVVAGLILGHKAPLLQTAPSRLAERSNWRTIAFVLENAVFLLIGLQARWIIEDVAQSALPVGRIVAVCAATLAAVVVLRMAWVIPARFLLAQKRPESGKVERPPLGSSVIVGWAGMRGVVTLAAAFVIPEETPHREILLLIAFTVVAGTLLLQGLTLGWLARALRLPSPDPAQDALARAGLLEQASKAGLATLDELERDDPFEVDQLIRQRVDQRNFAAWERLSTRPGEQSPSQRYAETRLAMIAAERERVLQVRSTGSVPSEVVAQVLAMLDVEETMIDRSVDEAEDLRAWQVGHVGDSCDHLVEFPTVDPAGIDATECADCVREGSTWVALRQCLSCGYVGCCDSSALRHASAHFRETQHPVMQSAEPGEDWRWCFVHHVTG